MSDKYNKTITVSELRELLKSRFDTVSESLDKHDEMQIAINLKIALKTVERYMHGSIEEIRNLDLAEQIVKEAEKLSEAKASSEPA